MPIFNPINPQLELARPWWWRNFRRCKPKVLIVIDGLSYTASGFGLSRFIEAIAHHPTATLRPTLTLAHRDNHSSSVTIAGTNYSVDTQFNFNTASPAVTRTNYDQIWLFGVNSNPISNAEVQTIADFMNNGGGVFATGDHAALGSGMSARLPRIRHMRNWNSQYNGNGGVPMGQETLPLSLDRIDTVVDPGANEIYQFNDQSDNIPQRIYPNYSVTGNNVTDWRASIHPVLRMPGRPLTRGPQIGGFSNSGPSGERGSITFSNDMDVLPDHPHESECFEVSTTENTAALNGTYSEAGLNFPEFPDKASGGGKVPAEILAYSVSGGRTVVNGGWKPPVRPRMFGAMSAYDGHAAAPISGSQRPGRIMCDATWHHFVNINLDGVGSPRSGLGSWAGSVFTPSDDLLKIYKYYQNMVSWLQPSNRVWCWMYIIFREAFYRSPVREEFFEISDLKTVPEVVGLGVTMSAAIDAIAGVGASRELISTAVKEANDGNAKVADIFDPLTSPLSEQEMMNITAFVMGNLAKAVIPELSEIDEAEKESEELENKIHDKFENYAKKSITKLAQEGAEMQLKLIAKRTRDSQKALKSFVD